MNSAVYYNKTMACSISSWVDVAAQRLLYCFWKRRDEGFMHTALIFALAMRNLGRGAIDLGPKIPLASRFPQDVHYYCELINLTIVGAFKEYMSSLVVPRITHPTGEQGSPPIPKDTCPTFLGKSCAALPRTPASMLSCYGPLHISLTRSNKIIDVIGLW